MKQAISATIESHTVEALKEEFSSQTRSQVIEEALEFWLAHKRKERLKAEALRLKESMGEELRIEESTLEDGLSGL